MIQININKVYQKIKDNGISLFSYNIPCSKAATIKVDSKYGIFINYNMIKNTDEEFLVATHEYGHCMTGATHKINSDFELICQHEYKANRKAILDFLPIELLKEAIDHGCKLKYEFAEYLNMPESFIEKAFDHYSAMKLI